MKARCALQVANCLRTQRRLRRRDRVRHYRRARSTDYLFVSHDLAAALSFAAVLVLIVGVYSGQFLVSL